VPAQLDPQRVPVLLALLAGGMYLCTLLVRPGPLGSERHELEQRARRRRSFALRGMYLMTLAGLCSGLAGGLLQGSSGAGALPPLLHAVFRVCWLPAYLLRDLQSWLAQLGVAGLELIGLLGLLLIPVFWFLIFLSMCRWWPRR
jgi:hypothetical protein